MITYQLKCTSDHEFEAWFRNSAGYDEQRASGDISCPLCGDQEITKAIMAPSIGKKGNSSTPKSDSPGSEPDPEQRASEVAREVLDAVETIRQHVQDNCDYVGNDFADEARKIHYGEADERGIYGEATSEDTQALDEEGIDVFRLPTPPRRDS